MKKKGFTLIELLAVIVILAVIALIATPLIMNVINDARKNSAKDSAYGIVKAMETSMASAIIKDDSKNYAQGTITKVGDTYKLNGQDLTVSMSGTKPDCLNLKVQDGKISGGFLAVNGYSFSIKQDGTINYEGEGEYNPTTCKIVKEGETDEACFTTEDVPQKGLVPVYDIHPNCVANAMDVAGYSEEDATTFCSRGVLEDRGSIDMIANQPGFGDQPSGAQMLEESGIITNVVYKKPIYEISENCVANAMTAIELTEEQATDYCAGKDVLIYQRTLNIYSDIEKGLGARMYSAGVLTITSYEDATIDKIITGYDVSCGTEVVIPETINGGRVTEIAASAFENKGLTSVTLSDTSISLGVCAFGKIESISSHNIPSSYECSDLFYVEGRPYKFEDGMTWAELLSAYEPPLFAEDNLKSSNTYNGNTTSEYFDDNMYYIRTTHNLSYECNINHVSNGYEYLQNNGQFVQASDLIIKDYNYEIYRTVAVC